MYLWTFFMKGLSSLGVFLRLYNLPREMLGNSPLRSLHHCLPVSPWDTPWPFGHVQPQNHVKVTIGRDILGRPNYLNDRSKSLLCCSQQWSIFCVVWKRTMLCVLHHISASKVRLSKRIDHLQQLIIFLQHFQAACDIVKHPCFQ